MFVFISLDMGGQGKEEKRGQASLSRNFNNYLLEFLAWKPSMETPSPHFLEKTFSTQKPEDQGQLFKGVHKNTVKGKILQTLPWEGHRLRGSKLLNEQLAQFRKAVLGLVISVPGETF